MSQPELQYLRLVDQNNTRTWINLERGRIDSITVLHSPDSPIAAVAQHYCSLTQEFPYLHWKPTVEPLCLETSDSEDESLPSTFLYLYQVQPTGSNEPIELDVEDLYPPEKHVKLALKTARDWLGNLDWDNKTLSKIKRFLSKLVAPFMYKKPFELFPHQRRLKSLLPADYNDTFLLHWFMGAGKTFSAVDFVTRAQASHVCAICLAGGITIQPWIGYIRSCLQVKGITQFYVLGEEQITRNVEIYQGAHVIIDEVHHYRNITDTMAGVLDYIMDSKAVLCLSGTPVVHKVSDLNPMARLIARDHNVSIDKPEQIRKYFEGRVYYVDQAMMEMRLSQSTKSKKKTIMAQLETLPRKKIPMSWISFFDYMTSSKRAFVLGEFEFGSSSRNSFKSQQKQSCVAESLKTQIICQDIIKKLDNPEIKRIALYSNYVEKGIKVLRKALEEHHIKVLEITGNVSLSDRNRIVQAYQHPSFKGVLLVSNVGGEGIRFFLTDYICLAAPPLHDSDRSQILRRFVFTNSHPEKRVIPVQEYALVIPTERPSDQVVQEVMAHFLKKWRPPETAADYWTPLIREYLEQGLKQGESVEELQYQGFARETKENYAAIEQLRILSEELDNSIPPDPEVLPAKKKTGGKKKKKVRIQVGTKDILPRRKVTRGLSKNYDHLRGMARSRQFKIKTARF